MNVLSLFDGMSCGRVALERCGFKINKYYPSEIDKYAITVAANNYLDTIHIGDVTKVRAEDLEPIDIVIGGSPCQGFSFAGKQLNFEDPRSKLFFEFVRLVKECKPKYFFLENVVMKKEYQDVISSYLGVEPIMLNSSLVSAQSRKRLYWTNIPGYTPPEDKGILLKDILVSAHTRFEHTKQAVEYMNRIEEKSGRSKWDFKFHSDTKEGKSSCLVANFYKGVPNNVLVVREATKEGKVEVLPGQYIGGDTVRRFTPIECERLQTLPDNYTAGVSNSQRYKMLGNGWTVDAVCEFFKHIPKDLDLF